MNKEPKAMFQGRVAWYALERGRPISVEMRTALSEILARELQQVLFPMLAEDASLIVSYNIQAIQPVAFDLQLSGDEDADRKVNAENVLKVLADSDILCIEGNSFPLYAMKALPRYVFIALFDRKSGKFLRWQKFKPCCCDGANHKEKGGCHGRCCCC